MLKVEDDRIISSHWQEEDDIADTSIRPLRLADYIGQERVKENINIFIANIYFLLFTTFRHFWHRHVGCPQINRLNFRKVFLLSGGECRQEHL